MEWFVDWMHLAHVRAKWWAFVNSVTNFWESYNVGNFLTS
jgi:hypothetical protein